MTFAAPSLPASAVGLKHDGVIRLLEVVETFNQEHPSDLIKKTRDIANKVVKPITKRTLPTGQQAYVFIENSKYRGTPTCFVSQTWGADAIGLLKAIISHGDSVIAKGLPPPTYYLDVACVDQHQIDQVSRCLFAKLSHAIHLTLSWAGVRQHGNAV